MSAISKLKKILYTPKRQEPEPETSSLFIDEGKFN